MYRMRPQSAPPRRPAIPGYTGHCSGHRQDAYMLRFAAAEDARRAQRREPDDYTPNVRHEFRLFEPTYICQDGTTKLPKASVPREAIARARGKRVYQSQNLKEMPLDRIQRRQLLIADTWKDHAYPSFQQPERPARTKAAGYQPYTKDGMHCQDRLRKFHHSYLVKPSRLDLPNGEMDMLHQSMIPGGYTEKMARSLQFNNK